VKHFYFIHDLVCGHLLFLPLFILAGLQLPHHIQTWLLYHNALSTDVVVSDILRYARKTQESGAGNEGADEDLVEQVTELRKVVQKQEQILINAGLLTLNTNDAVAKLVSSGADGVSISAQSDSQYTGGGVGPPNRAFSMSGMDVWNDMALGVSNTEPTLSQESHVIVSGSGLPPPPPPEPAARSVSDSGFSFTQPDTMPPR
jgi:callose synthase